ncbi:hypothetical protein C8E97_1970 [Saccharothrix australiensis]|uniref:Uncharacterized protein n=1 Tax=Saccharothrix australiensis TaxID=2072 RepID=A0A495VX46_9PSEU|nr:hypothetical protein C8E97_1970 [Saccharothrix australiensis]
MVLAALAVAGCGGDGSPSAPPPFSPSPSSTPSAALPTSLSLPGVPTAQPPPQSTAPPLPQARQVPADRVDAGALSDAYRRDVSVSADGRTVQVFSVSGGCKRASAEVEAQSADQVLITLVTTYYPASGEVCTEELFAVPVDVVLDAPLGERRIVLEARERTG